MRCAHMQFSGVFISLFIFTNQALKIGGNPVSLGKEPLFSQEQMNLFSLLIDLRSFEHF